MVCMGDDGAVTTAYVVSWPMACCDRVGVLALATPSS